MILEQCCWKSVVHSAHGTKIDNQKTKGKTKKLPSQKSFLSFLVVYKKKRLVTLKSEIRKRKIQNFGLPPIPGCFTNSFQPQRAEAISCLKTPTTKKSTKKVNLAPIEEK